MRLRKRKQKPNSNLKVVEVKYIPTADADHRLSRAVDILLRGSEPKEVGQSQLDNEKVKPSKNKPFPPSFGCNRGGDEEDY